MGGGLFPSFNCKWVNEEVKNGVHLVTGVFTRNMFKAFSAFEKLDVGEVAIDHVASIQVDSQPH